MCCVQVAVHDNTWVVAKPLDDWVITEVEDDENMPMLFYTLQGLKHSTYYEVTAKARNDIGISLATPHVFLTAKGRPSCRPGTNNGHNFLLQAPCIRRFHFKLPLYTHTPAHSNHFSQVLP